jgi:diguanylate cyclase
MDDVTGGQDEPKRPVTARRRGLGKGLGAILRSPVDEDERSQQDQLTGLPDRAALDQRFDEAMARCREDRATLALLVVGLDGFGDVNELYGHNVGDELLHEAAGRLSDARRRSDTVARFAGDEFVMVCPYVASADLACQLAARILDDLSRPATVENVELQLSASIGVVVTSPADTSSGPATLESLLGDASLAMRRAKDEGGGSWKLFDHSMREHVVVRSQGRQDLRTALEDDGLVLEYEDIVDLATGEAIAESAILGWSQPGTDVEQSQAPLDLVDEAGLAVPVGRWVLDQALADLKVRHTDSNVPEDFRVWVKVAPSLVADPALVDIVIELTEKHDVAPSVLGLDIREPSAAAAPSTEANLRVLQMSGVVVALDDFGSGQTNLALLQRLPISSLKLAPDLVAALDEDAVTVDELDTDADADAAPDTDADADARADTLSREAAALVRGLIELGRALGLVVVAQGVESEAQAMALRALGCTYAQGPFLFGDDPVHAVTDEPDDVAVMTPLTGVPDDLAEPSARVVPPQAQPPAEPPASVEPPPAPEPDPAPVPAPAPAESLWAPGTLGT